MGTMLFERTVLSRKPDELLATELAALRTTSALTSNLVLNGKLRPYSFTQHYVFSAPSTAAAVNS